MSIDKIAFKNKDLRQTEDIELLRSAYEDLLKDYQKEIKERVLLEMRIEGLIDCIVTEKE